MLYVEDKVENIRSLYSNWDAYRIKLLNQYYPVIVRNENKILCLNLNALPKYVSSIGQVEFLYVPAILSPHPSPQ
jgi:hypothetical protein